MNEKQESKTQRESYAAPAMVEYGAVAKLTQGDYCSVCWDVGAGRKPTRPPR